MATLKKDGYILIRSLFQESQLTQMEEEFNRLKGNELENKNIVQSNSYDADQKRFEIMNPPFLTRLYKNSLLSNLMNMDIEEKLKPNHRCGYFLYLEGSYIKPHFDHLLSDCMLLVGIKRKYGLNQPKGGILKLYIPKEITFNRVQQTSKISKDLRLAEIDLQAGDGILVLGGHILHECTTLEKGGERLICGMGYTIQRNRRESSILSDTSTKADKI